MDIHFIAEFIQIILGFSIFLFTWSTRKMVVNKSLFVLGVGCLVVSVLSFFQVISSAGIDLLQGGEYFTGQFAFASRLIFGSAMVHTVYVKVFEKETPLKHSLIIYIGALIITSTLILTGLFPQTYLPNAGLTLFGFICSCVIIGLFVTSTILLLFKGDMAHLTNKYLPAAIGASYLAEYILLFNRNNFEISIFASQILTILASIFIYRAIVLDNVYYPYQNMAYSLTETNAILRAERHEIINEIALLYGYLQLNKHREASAHLELLAANLSDRYNYQGLPTDAWLDVITSKQELAQSYGIKFEYHLVASPPSAPEQRRLLPKLLTNLLDNAIDAVAGQTEPWILLEWTWHKRGKMLTVKNCGPEIPGEIKARVFEPGLTTKGYGRGWGLAICYKIAKELGGDFEIDSNENTTTFLLTLPDDKNRQAAATHYLPRNSRHEYEPPNT